MPKVDLLERRLPIEAPPAIVFEFFTDPAKLVSWIGVEASLEPRPGGVFEFVMYDGKTCRGRYVEVERPRRLVFTWGVKQDDASSRVVIDIAPLAGGCELTLTHEMKPEWANFVEQARAAWAKMADALSVLLMCEAPAPVAKAEMLIRRPIAQVFEAFIDPAITPQIWFTKGSDRLGTGKKVEWTWEMYGFSVQVKVLAVEENKRILVEWPGYGAPTTIEWLFTPRPDDTTFVTIKNAGFQGALPEIMQQAVDATEGFTFVLAAAKALLEHNIRLNLVADRHPDGIGD